MLTCNTAIELIHGDYSDKELRRLQSLYLPEMRLWRKRWFNDHDCDYFACGTGLSDNKVYDMSIGDGICCLSALSVPVLLMSAPLNLDFFGCACGLVGFVDLDFELI